jgi:hypothetical protein
MSAAFVARGCATTTHLLSRYLYVWRSCKRPRLSDKTNPPSKGMSLNRSQCGNCSTDYNTPRPVPKSSADDSGSRHRANVPLVDR